MVTFPFLKYFHLIDSIFPSMKNILCFGLFLLFNVSALSAQVKITVTGQVLDGSNQEPLPFVNIAFATQAENTMVTGTISDGDGRFEIIDLPTGKYIISFCCRLLLIWRL